MCAFVYVFVSVYVPARCCVCVLESVLVAVCAGVFAVRCRPVPSAHLFDALGLWVRACVFHQMPTLSFSAAATLSSRIKQKAAKLRKTTFKKRRNFSIANGHISIATETSLNDVADDGDARQSGMHKMFKLYSLMDQDNSGNVESHEFVSTFEGIVDPTFRRWIMITTGFGNREATSPEEFQECLRALFKLADINGDGSLSVLEFKALFKVRVFRGGWHVLGRRGYGHNTLRSTCVVCADTVALHLCMSCASIRSRPLSAIIFIKQCLSASLWLCRICARMYWRWRT